MKRTRHSQNTNAQDFVVYEDNFGANLQRQLASIGRHLTPSPEQVNSRPSKVRRHGSKFLSVLRSLTNSSLCPTLILPPDSQNYRYLMREKLRALLIWRLRVVTSVSRVQLLTLPSRHHQSSHLPGSFQRRFLFLS